MMVNSLTLWTPWSVCCPVTPTHHTNGIILSSDHYLTFLFSFHSLIPLPITHFFNSQAPRNDSIPTTPSHYGLTLNNIILSLDHYFTFLFSFHSSIPLPITHFFSSQAPRSDSIPIASSHFGLTLQLLKKERKFSAEGSFPI